jgi:hypothetical protein
MMRIAAKADANRPKSQGVRFEIKPWQKNVTILWERATPAPPGEGIENPETGSGPPIIRSGEIEPVKMTDYGIFAATEKSDVPYAFVIDARATHVVENLLTHGIVVERLNEATKLRVDQFVIAKSEHSGREFQKHHELTLEGKWKSRDVTFDAGTFIVRTNQPLARLAFYLLDPRSDDGLFEWGFFDELLGDVAPVAKVMKPAPLDATIAGSAAE